MRKTRVGSNSLAESTIQKMKATQNYGPRNEALETNRLTIVGRLNEHINKRLHSGILRPDQKDVINSFAEFLQNNQTAGYIDAPTAFGKTLIIAELAAALKGTNIYILSPTQTILEQTARRLPTEASSYYAHKKDGLGAEIVNTTYQSFLYLIKTGKIDPTHIEMIMCDELHEALGEERFKLFRTVPNAIKVGLTATPYFGQLDGYEARKLLDKNEPWIDLFTKPIYEMGVEEAITKGIQTPIENILVRTEAIIGNIDIDKGDYNRFQLNQYLNTRYRNNMAVAILAGVDKVPELRLSDDKRAELQKLHDKIAGKRVIVFGISVENIEELSKRLNDVGVSSMAVHGETKMEDRQNAFRLHEEGTMNVLLTVDLLRKGWDSPKTEVALMLQPTYSGIVAMQRLGRVSRPSPDTEKTNSIVIEFVDTYEEVYKTPVLVPFLFDPEFSIRGSQTGVEKKPIFSFKLKREPIIEVSGEDIDVLLERFDLGKLGRKIRTGFAEASTEETDNIINSVIEKVQKEVDPSNVFAFYSKIAEGMPYFVRDRKLATLVKEFSGINTNESERAARVILYLHMKTILSATEKFLGDDLEENNEITHAAIAGALSSIRGIRGRFPTVFSQRIYGSATAAVKEFLAYKEEMPISWVRYGFYNRIAKMVRNIKEDGWKTTEEEIDKFVKSMKVKLKRQERIKAYIEFQIAKHGSAVEDAAIESDPNQKLYGVLAKEAVNSALRTLTPRLEKIIKLRFGIDQERELTLEEIGQEYGFSIERIRQLESKALRALRNESRARLLRQYV